jgi:hypothetical protein
MRWELLLSVLLHHAFGGWTAPSADNLSPVTPPIPVVDSVQVSAFGEHRSGLTIQFGDEVSTYDVMAVTAMPGSRMPIQIAAEGENLVTASDSSEPRYELTAESGRLVATGPDRWEWTAPIRSGVAPIEVRDRMTGTTATLNVLVLVPYNDMVRGRLNGYRIGNYPSPRTGYADFYARPQGFIEVTPENENLAVAPHFRLGQFLCKEPGGFPKYLVLRPMLLTKLEMLLAAANEHGYHADTFQLMSAYRTPFYNRTIGNTTTFSRHHYGDAADVLIDQAPADGVMDDLNGDGRHTVADAHVLANLVESLTKQDAEFIGGLGTYGATRSHGPFVHVDVRGFDARWGS